MPADLDDVLAQCLSTYATDVPVPTVDLAAVKRGGTRRRRQRHGGIAVCVLAAVAVTGVAVPLAVHGRGTPSRVTPAATPSAAPPVDPDQAAAYYRERQTTTAPAGRPDVSIVWQGHDRLGWVSEGTGPQSAASGVGNQPAVTPQGTAAEAGTSPAPSDPQQLPQLTWDQRFALPATTAGLRAYYDAHPLSYVPGSPVGIAAFCTDIATGPGPAAVKVAALQLVSSLTGNGVISTTDGQDALGRPARIITVAPPHAEVLRRYLDSATGQELEEDALRSASSTPESVTVYDDVAYTQDHVTP